MQRPVTLYVPEADYAKLEKLAKDQHVGVDDLFLTRGVKLLLGDADDKLRAAAADVASRIDKKELEKLVGLGQALLALKVTVPS